MSGTLITRELMDEMAHWTNFVLSKTLWQDVPLPDDDAVYTHVRSLKFPLTVTVVSGETRSGLQRHDGGFSFQMSPLMQMSPKAVTTGVCAILLYAWTHRLDLSVIVHDIDKAGFAFHPGKDADDVNVTPTMRVAPPSKPEQS